MNGDAVRVLVTTAPLAAGIVLLVLVLVAYGQKWEIRFRWERKPPRRRGHRRRTRKGPPSTGGPKQQDSPSGD